MTYAPEHEKELLNRSIRRRMGMSKAPSSTSQQAGTTQAPQYSRDTQRCLLRLEERLPLAALTPRVSALGDGLLLVQTMANRRDFRTTQRGVARAAANASG